MNDWYDSWFESPWYMRMYRHRSDDEARRAVHLVADVAGVPRGSRVLDLACGYGRHALALAEAGYHVNGLDSSIYLIDRAREVYPHPNVSYYVGDMRGPYPHVPYDVIVNFFTSFGYFDHHDENAAVIRTMAESVVPGGTVIMDFFNADRVRRDLVPETLTMLDGVLVIQERWIEEPFVRKRITINNPCCAEQTFDERVWLYPHDELAAMFIAAGLEIQVVCGTYDGTPFNDKESERCIIIAQRPLS